MKGVKKYIFSSSFKLCFFGQWKIAGAGGAAAQRRAGAPGTHGETRSGPRRTHTHTHMEHTKAVWRWLETHCGFVRTEHLKTARQKKREEELMAKLMEIVSDRNAIVEGLDEDRIRCVALVGGAPAL